MPWQMDDHLELVTIGPNGRSRLHGLDPAATCRWSHRGALEVHQRQLGQASVQITMDRYSHLLDESYADESDKLEPALWK
jgi:integrase